MLQAMRLALHTLTVPSEDYLEMLEGSSLLCNFFYHTLLFHDRVLRSNKQTPWI